MHRLNKLNFFLVMTLILSPLALKAQTATPKWNGFHVGVIGGTAEGNYDLKSDDTGGATKLSSSLAGGRVGVQGGVDANFKGLVVGAVADWSWMDAKFKFDDSGSIMGTPINTSEHSTVTQMTTIRGRAGRSYGRLLPYVQGGLLLAGAELKLSGIGVPTTVIKSGIHPGFVVGAGVEYMVARHYSLSTEYGYNHVNGINLMSPNAGAGSVSIGTEYFHYNTVTVGINYHF